MLQLDYNHVKMAKVLKANEELKFTFYCNIIILNLQGNYTCGHHKYHMCGMITYVPIGICCTGCIHAWKDLIIHITVFGCLSCILQVL
jgi:hypothetical protein